MLLLVVEATTSSASSFVFYVGGFYSTGRLVKSVQNFFVLGLVFLGVTRVGISAVSKALLGGSKRMTRKDVHGKMVDTTLNVYRHLFITTVIAFAITGVVKPCLWLDMLYPPPPPAPPSRAWWMIK